MGFSRPLAAGLAVAATVAVAVPLPAGAAPAPVKGKLSKRGYTVIALDTRGRVRTVSGKAFRLVPPARTVTLHLRSRRGEYAGPIVVGGTRKLAIVGVRAGADLGKVDVRRGYAVANAEPADLVERMKARARKGRPVGARILGRVRSSTKGRAGLGRDQDRDGLPGAFDVDDDGDLVYDNVDRGGATARTSQTADAEFNARWIMNGGLEVSYLADQRGVTNGVSGYALNQNAAGPFAASGEFEKLRDLLMVERGALIFPLPDRPAELDCGGLSYCRAGGTGFFHTRNQKFPEGFDSDGDGFGTMQPLPRFAEGQDGLGLIQSVDPSSVFGLAPNATAAQVQAGDVFVETFASPPHRAVTLRSVFGTLPALQGWGDGTRNVTIDYPVPRGAEGAENNGFTVRPNAAGRHVVRLTIWRPQRPAVVGSGEGSGWIDLGGLTYTVVGKTAEQNRRLFRCGGSSYSTTDGNLSVTAAGLLDKATDQPVNAANTLTFSVDLTDCLTRSGITEATPPTITIFVSASSQYGDDAEGLGFAFKLIDQDDVGSDAFTGTWKFTNGTPGPDLDWTIRANSASASRIGVIVYDGKTVVSGTPPAGWSCAPGSAGPNSAYICEGSTLSPGQSASGQVKLDGAYSQDKPVEMLVCDANNACQGLGMTYKP